MGRVKGIEPSFRVWWFLVVYRGAVFLEAVSKPPNADHSTRKVHDRVGPKTRTTFQ